MRSHWLKSPITLTRYVLGAQLLLQAAMSPLLEQLYVCVQQEMRIRRWNFRRR